MLLSNIQLIEYPIFPLNQIIWFIKSVLIFYNEWPEYNIPDEELDDRLNASLIHFSVYTSQGRCATHVIIPNGPSVSINE